MKYGQTIPLPVSAGWGGAQFQLCGQGEVGACPGRDHILVGDIADDECPEARSLPLCPF